MDANFEGGSSRKPKGQTETEQSPQMRLFILTETETDDGSHQLVNF